MKAIKHITVALVAAAALTLTGCAGEAPTTEPKPSASQPAVEEPTATPPPTPVVQKFGTPDSTFMEVISEAGVMVPGLPESREVRDQADFDIWIAEGVEIWNADTCGEVTLVHSGGETALACEGGRFFLKG